MGYAAYAQSQSVLPVLLVFTGIAFYSLRGYAKYVSIYTEMSIDSRDLEKLSREASEIEEKKEETAGLGYGVLANLRWFVGEQRKILSFDEGVFIFMLSLALILNELTPMLWVFAISQVFIGLGRVWQRGSQLGRSPQILIKK